jgi:hypothetical protein
MAGMGIRGIGWLIMSLLVLCDAAGPAQAQEEPTESETRSDMTSRARDAFVLGTSLAQQGQWRDALKEFEHSASIRPHATTTYNIGFCERALGHYTRARERFMEALAQDQAAETSDQELPDELLRSAKIYLQEAEERIARIAVTLDPADAALTVDGRPLALADAEKGNDRPVLVAGVRDRGAPEPPPARRFTLLLDPGHHLFVIAGDGTPDAVVERSFSRGAEGELALRAPEPARPTEPMTSETIVKEPGSREPVPPIAPPEEPVVPPFGDTPGYVMLGIGAAGVTLSGILAAVFAVNKADLDDVCIDGACPSDRQRQIDTTNGVGTASLVALGVGGASLGTAIALLVVGGPAPDDLSLAPLLLPGGIGMRISF